MKTILFLVITLSTILLLIIFFKLHRYVWYRINKGYIRYVDFIYLSAKQIRINRQGNKQ